MRIPSKRMIYIWQCPVMLMSWSWLTFLLALTLHVVAPLAAREKQNDRNVALFYCVACAVVVLNFAWSSFWHYRIASLIRTQEEEGGSRRAVVPTDAESGSDSEKEQTTRSIAENLQIAQA
ncbi:hypothetical protein EDD36DRAFT_479267 [Exophiala viscosa]|uniref:Uncharacterized protein n=1 Tax=Exophiala viscosa TaxID=2486360 RepID=A0AAN6IH55_9EURO|nr:hypothetical protein EDD36DRAFT_479267 [Exophiala viscosa]